MTAYHAQKKPVTGLGRALIFWCLCLISSPVSAQSDAHSAQSYSVSQVGIIDLGRVLRQSEAMGRVRQLLDVKRQEFQVEFSARERELLAKEKQLKEERTSLSEAEYSQRVAAFQAEVSDVQQQIQSRRQSLDQAFGAAQDQIRALTTEIVAAYSTKQEIDIILNRDSVFIFRNQLDITDEIARQLNEQTVELSFELNERQVGSALR